MKLVVALMAVNKFLTTDLPRRARARRVVQISQSERGHGGGWKRRVLRFAGQSAILIGRQIMINEEAIKNALRAVKYPGFSRDIVSFGLVKEIGIHDGAVQVAIQFTSGTPEIFEQVRAESERVLKALPGVKRVRQPGQQPVRRREGRIRGRAKIASPESNGLWRWRAARGVWGNPRRR
jgi:metal-sulfur cluster biosynthetic enzyme